MTLREEVEREMDQAIRRTPIALEVLTTPESELAGNRLDETQTFKLLAAMDRVRRDAILRLASAIDELNERLD